MISTSSHKKMALLLKNKYADIVARHRYSDSDKSRAVSHNKRLTMHTEYSFDNHDNVAITEFLEWVRKLLPFEKYCIFIDLFRLPMPTTDLVSSIYNELERVFDAQNPSQTYRFIDSDYNIDWDAYKKSREYSKTTWRHFALSTLKSDINAIIVVDTAYEQSSQYPEPYYYSVSPDKIYSYDLNADNEITSLVYKESDSKFIAIDDKAYTVIMVNKGQIISEDVRPHDLGYAPARFFWDENLTSENKYAKRAPISYQLSNLDWLAFFYISKRHLDLYAPYPIYAVYPADCDYLNSSNGEYCDSGFLKDRDHKYMFGGQNRVVKCPVCSTKRLSGVGSIIEKPIPEAGEPELKSPVEITTVDVNSLNYNVNEVERLKKHIFQASVGVGGDVQDKESINELQVTANFESKVSVINTLKAPFERIQEFIESTACKLRYGDRFLGCSVSLGTKFFAHSLTELYSKYKEGKDLGLSTTELDEIANQILDAEYKDAGPKISRIKLLKELEPHRHYTLKELMDLADKKLIDAKSLILKINFITFVERFERENTNILSFGSNMDHSSKINLIQKTLLSYGNEINLPSSVEQEPDAE